MWMITYDWTEEKDVVVKSVDWRPGQLLNQNFRLLDDDGEIYYDGVSDDSESERAFDPLDDYGTPNAGCTGIQYLRNRPGHPPSLPCYGKWETL